MCVFHKMLHCVLCCYRECKRTQGVSTTDLVGRMLLMTKAHHSNIVSTALFSLYVPPAHSTSLIQSFLLCRIVQTISSTQTTLER